MADPGRTVSTSIRTNFVVPECSPADKSLLGKWRERQRERERERERERQREREREREGGREREKAWELNAESLLSPKVDERAKTL